MTVSIVTNRSVMGAGAVVAAVGLVVATGAGANQSPARPKNIPDANHAIAAVKAGKGRPIPGAPDVHFSGFWQGCRFIIHASNVAHYETDAGPISIEEKPEPLASTPPAGPCAERPPTKEEIDAMKAEVDARNERVRPQGAPPLPAYVPDVPRTGELVELPPIPPRS